MSKTASTVITAEITEATGIEAKVVETVMTQFFDIACRRTKRKSHL